jgi:hypothetical protein
MLWGNVPEYGERFCTVAVRFALATVVLVIPGQGFLGCERT